MAAMDIKNVEAGKENHEENNTNDKQNERVRTKGAVVQIAIS